MDLKLFFDPVDKGLNISASPPSCVAHSLYINGEKWPAIEGMDIAIIGIRESRGAEQRHQKGLAGAADEIRKRFYELKKGAGTYKVVDLGNIRNGPEPEDTYLRLKEVCGYLMDEGVLPVLIGGAQDADLGQYFAYENRDKLITVLNIDHKVDLEDPKEDVASRSHIHRIFKHSPNFLFNYYHLAYQSYLVETEEVTLMEKLYFEAIRLGVVRENVKEMEPVIRDADMLTFDVSAIQIQYCPGGVDSRVYGLTGEEACQLCWYAGLNDKLSSFGVYEYDVEKDTEDRRTAFVIATMLWYFIEGYYHRKGDKNFQSSDYLVYEVSLHGEPDSIRFYKSKLSEKWWMEVPHPEDKNIFMRSAMVPCSYSDYETALRGELPGRWISTYSRMY